MSVKSTAQVTITDITDAYSVMMSSETYTFVGGINGSVIGDTCSTKVTAYCGTSLCSKITIGTVTSPTGISATVSNNDTSSPTITFTTTAIIGTACEATIPVTVDGITINKKFSFAVAKTGATGAKGDTGDTGKGISKVETFYLTTDSASGVTTSTTGWDKTPTATTTTNKYIWSYQKTTYTDNTTSSSTPAIIGTHGATGSQGATGATGKGISKIETFYLTTSSQSGVTTSTTGWNTTPTATTTTNKYIWSYQKTTYTDNTTSSSTPAIVGTHGATGAKGDTGDAGADAIRLEITSSDSIVFKNSTGSVTLTAHAYKGSEELTIDSNGVCKDANNVTIGTVKWYKGAATTGAASKSVTVTASEVTNVLLYTAKLE